MSAADPATREATPVLDLPDLRGAEGLYVHIPFCSVRCGYCDFATGIYEEGLARRYLGALDRELDAWGPTRPRTIYLGGGTPSRLATAEIRRLGDILARRVDRSASCEFTAEANPNTLDPARIDALRSIGVTRLSLGAQTFEPRLLRVLDRDHDPAHVERAVAAARAAGFASVSLDLIFAIPGETVADLARDLDAVIALAPDHVSAYGLIYEPATPLTHRVERGELPRVPEEEAAAMVDLLYDTMERAGFERYEIANFARPGHACRHNLIYWDGGSYLGVGLAAHSFAGGVGLRVANARNLGRYLDLVERQGRAVAETDDLAPPARARELLVVGLRRAAGVSLAELRARTGVDLADALRPTIEFLAGEGLVAWDGDLLRLTRKGLPVADAVFRELL